MTTVAQKQGRSITGEDRLIPDLAPTSQTGLRRYTSKEIGVVASDSGDRIDLPDEDGICGLEIGAIEKLGR